jgi:hypothetical protein
LVTGLSVLGARNTTEACHSWFGRSRKLLVRYEQFERSFVAFNHLAAAIIAFRRAPLTINRIDTRRLQS